MQATSSLVFFSYGTHRVFLNTHCAREHTVSPPPLLQAPARIKCCLRENTPIVSTISAMWFIQTFLENFLKMTPSNCISGTIFRYSFLRKICIDRALLQGSKFVDWRCRIRVDRSKAERFLKFEISRVVLRERLCEKGEKLAYPSSPFWYK